MSRILRNYLISFAIIGLFFLAVHFINRMVEERMQDAVPPPVQAPGQASTEIPTGKGQ